MSAVPQDEEELWDITEETNLLIVEPCNKTIMA